MSPKIYAKAIVAALGAGLTAAAGIVTADSTAGKIITIALAMLTVVGTYLVPNAPAARSTVQLQRDRARQRPASPDRWTQP